MKNFKVLEFRFITESDKNDAIYNDGRAWSRPYEYKLVLDKIKELSKEKNTSIHNSSWGYAGVHVTFKNELDNFSDNVLHTDINPSSLPKTDIYNITQNEPKFKENFDFVINISTLEEVNFDHSIVFYNLLDQVKVGGYLICTFDIPGLNLSLMENVFDYNIVDYGNRLSGNNTKYPNPVYGHLNCGLLVVEKL